MELEVEMGALTAPEEPLCFDGLCDESGVGEGGGLMKLEGFIEEGVEKSSVFAGEEELIGGATVGQRVETGERAGMRGCLGKSGERGRFLLRNLSHR